MIVALIGDDKMARSGPVRIARPPNAIVEAPVNPGPVTTSGVRAEIEAAFTLFRRQARRAIWPAKATPRTRGQRNTE